MKASAEKKKTEDKSKFYTLTELAKKTNSEEEILVSMAIQGDFRFFIAANNWRAHIWRKPINNADIALDNHLDMSGDDWIRETPLEEPIKLTDSFLQLKTSSVIAYKLNNTVNVASFDADDFVQGPDKYCFELRLCDPVDFSKSYEINLKDHKLVAMHHSLPIIKKILREKTSGKNNEPLELSDSERTKLLKVIGALTIAITGSANKFQINGRPNVKQISEKVLDSLNKLEHQGIDIKKTGLSDTNLRDVIGKGLNKILDE